MFSVVDDSITMLAAAVLEDGSVALIIAPHAWANDSRSSHTEAWGLTGRPMLKNKSALTTRVANSNPDDRRCPATESMYETVGTRWTFGNAVDEWG